MEEQIDQNPVQEFVPEVLTSPAKPWRSWVIPFLLSILVILLMVTGYLYYQNQQLKQMLASYATPIPSPVGTLVQEGTANWKTYTNIKYGYSFKYPNDWEVKTTLENFRFVMGPVSELTTYLTRIDEQKVIYLMMSGPGQTTLTTAEWKKGGYKVEESQSKISGLTAISRVFTKSNTYQKEVEIVLSDQQYNTAFGINNKSLEGTFDQILSTFKFLEATPSSSPSI